MFLLLRQFNFKTDMTSRYQWTSHQNYKYSQSLADVMSVAAKRQAGHKVKFGFPMQVTVYTKTILKKNA